MSGITMDELFAVLLARDLRTTDRVIQVGANMPMARAGALLAHLTRLPDARIYIGLGLDNLADGREPPPVRPFLFDSRSLEAGEAWMWQSSVFDDVSAPDVFFMGGLQIDRRGNVNLLGIRQPDGGWRVRGPGAVALASMSTNCAGYYVVMARHEPRVFVEAVDCITALGDRTRRAELGFPGGGLRLVVSPLGVFELDAAGDLRVRSLHPGVGAEEVRAGTGFELAVPDDVPVTELPTAAELRVLREEVDRAGLLRGDGRSELPAPAKIGSPARSCPEPEESE